jgi:hypothetical protein
LSLAGVLILVSAGAALAAAPAASLYRVFMRDGTTVVSFGEFARVDDRVVISMPIGGSADEPRLHVAVLPAALVDWARTERYADSVRYQRYAETRGEEDFQLLSNEVARTLNDIALTTDRAKALAIAEGARRMLADWPPAHFLYRQQDVREIVALVDDAIAGLKGLPRADMDLSLVAIERPDLEPVMGMPTLAEQVDQISRVAALAATSAERIALLQAGVQFLTEAPADANFDVAGRLARFQVQIQRELQVDAQYARLSQRLTTQARRAAAAAKVKDVEKLLDRIAPEDQKLGSQRPDMVEAMRGSVQSQLAAARQLRLRRDQWTLRKAAFRSYIRLVQRQVSQLEGSKPALEAIRRLDGPAPERLLTQRSRLRGGADQLQRLRIPEDVRSSHELLVGAWRFAESAVEARFAAASSGNVAKAWEASSAAAGALMLMTRAQQEIRALLEPPKLQ